ncbi:MAG: hypothetical protein LBM16_04920, partial [Clostridiales bacterium]|nr:hypothetical protein [Clostridiales bacterium]
GLAFNLLKRWDSKGTIVPLVGGLEGNALQGLAFNLLKIGIPKGTTRVYRVEVASTTLFLPEFFA